MPNTHMQSFNSSLKDTVDTL